MHFFETKYWPPCCAFNNNACLKLFKRLPWALPAKFLVSRPKNSWRILQFNVKLFDQAGAKKHFDMPLDIKKKLFSFMRIFIFFHIKYLKKMCKIYEVEIFFRILNSIQKKLHFNSYIGKDTCNASVPRIIK